MVSDPNNFGLGELGQRVQALGDPAPEPRLRPYQGGSAPPAPMPPQPFASQSPMPPAAAQSAPERPAQPAPHNPSSYGAWPSTFTAAPAPPEPFPDTAVRGSSSNGYSTPSAVPFGSVPSSSPAAASTSAGSNSAGLGQAASFPSAAPLPPAAPDDPNAPKSGIQRAINAVRATLPLVQRLLPLLEGNLATAATAITALVASQPHHPAPPPPPPAPAEVHVDLEPIERGLAEVRTSNRELRTQIGDQATTLKRVEDQLDRVREATDRNTLEQQELVEDLRAVGSRVSTFAIIGLVLLVLSLLLNGYLIFQLQRILH